MSDLSWLDDAAAFYDLDLRGRREDIEFWVNLARHIGGLVLEAGCGTGRILEAIVGAGIEAVGFDVSPAMITAARGRLGDGVQLFEADMRHLDLGREFELILVPLATFYHLLTPADQVLALRALRRHLAHGAVLALDLPVLEPRQWQPGARVLRREWRRRAADGRLLEKWARATPDFARQVQAIEYEYRAAGATVARVAFELRFIFPAELEHLLARAGLAIDRVYGSYDLDPFDSTSSRMLVIAREETGPVR